MTLSSSSSAKEAFRLDTVEGFCGGGGVAFVEEGESRLEGGGGLFGVTRRGKVLKGATKGVFCGRKASGERESIVGSLDRLLLPATWALCSYRGGAVFCCRMMRRDACSDGRLRICSSHTEKPEVGWINHGQLSAGKCLSVSGTFRADKLLEVRPNPQLYPGLCLCLGSTWVRMLDASSGLEEGKCFAYLHKFKLPGQGPVSQPY